MIRGPRRNQLARVVVRDFPAQGNQREDVEDNDRHTGAPKTQFVAPLLAKVRCRGQHGDRDGIRAQASIENQGLSIEIVERK